MVRVRDNFEDTMLMDLKIEQGAACLLLVASKSWKRQRGEFSQSF